MWLWGSAGAEELSLSKERETRVTRFLHPLPKELRLKGTASRVPVAGWAVEGATGPSTREEQMAADFSERWEERFGTPANAGEAKLRIVAGLVKTSAAIQEAATRGLFDARYLASRRHPEQAYALATEVNDQQVTVTIAANGTAGLYYGLVTLDQLTKSLSTRDAIVLPHANIVDWPDIRLRGSWTVLSHHGKDEKALQEYDRTLREYSRWKCNLAEAWHLFADKLSPEGKVKAYWTYPKDVIEFGKRYAVEVFPGTGHITGKAGPPDMRERFPGAAGTPKVPERKIYSLCHSSPDTREMLVQYLASIASQFDFAEIWMTELEGPRGCCHCPQCKGNLRTAFVKETETLMHAYREARKLNPKFRIILGLTQGSYPHNLAMLKHIPKEVILNFYNGKMTYRTYFKVYNLPPSAQEMQRMGYTLGSTPSPIETLMKFPFQTPQYCRLLCGEAEDRHLDFVMLQLFPDPFAQGFNAQACAEFLWNSSGRTAEEFTIAWAARKGWDRPEEAAAIIHLTEYAARGLHCNSMRDMVDAIVRFMLGRDRASSSTYLRFEFRTHEEMARVRSLCEEGAARAKRLKTPELLASCELLTLYATILERYAWCAVNPKDAAIRKEAKEEIKEAVSDLREAWDRWIAFRKDVLERCRRLDYLSKQFDAYLKTWEPIFGEERSKDSADAAALMLAKETGQVSIKPLENAWKFKPAGKEAPEQKPLLPDTKDGSWSTVRSDKGCGWEGQGFPDYTGYGCYRQKLSIPRGLAANKHLYLVFLAVDEDAEIHINGKKAFEHSHKTVGGRAGSTWDKPFSFDAKSFLKPGAENLIAVSVYNRSGMGGIWKPVTLVASDVAASTGALVQLVVTSEESEGLGE